MQFLREAELKARKMSYFIADVLSYIASKKKNSLTSDENGCILYWNKFLFRALFISYFSKNA